MKPISDSLVRTLGRSASTERNWTLRDDNARHVHGRIPTNQHQITLTLSWKKDRSGERLEISRYWLDLQELLRSGYLTKSGGFFRLRFQRNTNREIALAINFSSPALTIGTIPPEARAT